VEHFQSLRIAWLWLAVKKKKDKARLKNQTPSAEVREQRSKRKKGTGQFEGAKKHFQPRLAGNEKSATFGGTTTKQEKIRRLSQD